VLYELAALLPPFRAPNMNGLYTKVMKGSYEPIPSFYSPDLSMMIKGCLQVSPLARPTCDKILKMPGLLNHLSGTLEQLEVLIPDESEKLLGTIRCPLNLGQITERMPKANYGIKRTQSLPPEKLDVLPEL